MGFFQQVSGPFSLPKLGGPDRRRLDAAQDLDQVRARPNTTASRPSPRPSRCGRRSKTPPRIHSIEIATFRVAVEIIGKDPEKWRPKTRETADHSLPYCTAVALVDGEISARQFTRRTAGRPGPARPGFADHGRRRSRAHGRLSRGYSQPGDRHPDDGTKLVEEVAFPPGHDKNPLTDAPARRQVPRPGRPGPRPGVSASPDLGPRLARLETIRAPRLAWLRLS